MRIGLSKIIAAFLLVGLLTGGGGYSCSSGGGESRLEALERNRQLWTSQGLSSYRYEVIRDCFCLSSGHRFQVVVEDQSVVSAIDLDRGEAVENPEQVFGTIDDYFDLLLTVLDGGPNVYQVNFDEQFGYPRSATLDPVAQVIDDELSFELSLLTESTLCGQAVCAPGLECCNASCGICTEPGGVCIQIACEQ